MRVQRLVCRLCKVYELGHQSGADSLPAKCRQQGNINKHKGLGPAQRNHIADCLAITKHYVAVRARVLMTVLILLRLELHAQQCFPLRIRQRREIQFRAMRLAEHLVKEFSIMIVG